MTICPILLGIQSNHIVDWPRLLDDFYIEIRYYFAFRYLYNKLLRNPIRAQPNFDIDERALAVGVRVLVNTVEQSALLG